MTNTMTRAHEIRKEAATKWNCKVSEIIFSICLEMAWAEIKENKMTELTIGTEKQIAYAETIREELLEELTVASVQDLKKELDDGCKRVFSETEIKENIEKIKNVESAIWWINVRDCKGSDIAYLINKVDIKREYR